MQYTCYRSVNNNQNNYDTIWQEIFAGFSFCGWSIFAMFVGLIFVEACTHAHYVLYNQAYFVGLIL